MAETRPAERDDKRPRGARDREWWERGVQLMNSWKDFCPCHWLLSVLFPKPSHRQNPKSWVMDPLLFQQFVLIKYFRWKKKLIQCSLIAFAVLVKVPKGAVTKTNFSSNLSLNFKSSTKIWESEKMYENIAYHRTANMLFYSNSE